MVNYCTVSQVRTKSGLTSSEVSDNEITVLIPFASAEVENTAGQKFENGTSVTEYYNVYLPKRADDVLPNRILLDHYPVQSITSFVLMDASETAHTTLDTLSAAEILAGTFQSDDYYCDAPSGIVELTTQNFDFVPNRAKITYTYGYVGLPDIVSEIAANLAAIRAWINFLGGNYDRLNSYTVPEQSYNKGDFYDRGLKMIEQLKKGTEELFNQVGKKQRSQIATTSGGFF